MTFFPFFLVLLIIQTGLWIFVPVQGSLIMEVTGDKGLYVHGMNENSVYSYTAHASSTAPYRFAYVLIPGGNIVSLSAPRMMGFTRETFSPLHDISSCTFEMPVHAMQTNIVTRWMLQDGTLRQIRDTYHLVTSWNGTGLVQYASHKDGERPVVHQIQATGNSTGNISHFFE